MLMHHFRWWRSCKFQCSKRWFYCFSMRKLNGPLKKSVPRLKSVVLICFRLDFIREEHSANCFQQTGKRWMVSANVQLVGCKFLPVDRSPFRNFHVSMQRNQIRSTNLITIFLENHRIAVIFHAGYWYQTTIHMNFWVLLYRIALALLKSRKRLFIASCCTIYSECRFT